MNRRTFIKFTAASTLIAGSGGIWSSCRKNLRSNTMPGHPDVTPDDIKALGSDGYKILYYASLAPSGHNSQPWFVKIENELDWVIGSDASRRLPVVDPDNREVILSIGAFVENLVQAAGVLGYKVETSILAETRHDPDVIRVRLTKSSPQPNTLSKILSRRTLKSNMRDLNLKAKDVEYFSKLSGGHFHYFPKGSHHCKLLADEALENFMIQFKNKKAIAEAAEWTRLKDGDALRFRDGLTPDGMEINGLAGWYVRNFMDKEDVQSEMYIKKGIEKTQRQVHQGGGWIVLTSRGRKINDLIDCGRRFQRIALHARDRMVAIHPMTQTIEEANGQTKIKENHSPATIPQFMLRVGYVDKYPHPVSLRRPVEWFVRS